MNKLDEKSLVYSSNAFWDINHLPSTPTVLHERPTPYSQICVTPWFVKGTSTEEKKGGKAVALLRFRTDGDKRTLCVNKARMQQLARLVPPP